MRSRAAWGMAPVHDMRGIGNLRGENSTVSLICVALFYQCTLNGSSNVPLLVLSNILVGHMVPMRALHIYFCVGENYSSRFSHRSSVVVVLSVDMCVC